VAKFPIYPKNPERICWGCDKFCPAHDMCCWNGTIRTPHPCELMGEDWYEWLQKQEHPRWMQTFHSALHNMVLQPPGKFFLHLHEACP
jgi:hypothetical protein